MFVPSIDTTVDGEWEGWDPVNRFDRNLSWRAIVTPTDRSKSVRQSLCNQSFRWRFCPLVTMLYKCVFFVGAGALSRYCTESDLFLFLLCIDCGDMIRNHQEQVGEEFLAVTRQRCWTDLDFA